MYCNKKNVNILTALLVEHGVRHVVVCPGSRNAPLVHNFSQCEKLECHAATDERSAGFLALGLRQQSQSPVAICVTSGSALLNVLPAVAEATYQQQGIVVVSADRPSAWVDQLDGQTLPQPQALGVFAPVSVTLPEVGEDETEAWHCNRLVNEALLANKAPGHPSVHINVPLSEPLFEFTVEELPRERVVKGGQWSDAVFREAILEEYEKANRPMVVMGQLSSESALEKESIACLQKGAVVLAEPISMEGLHDTCTDQMLALLNRETEAYHPDWILYVGGHTVSKRLRHFLRAQHPETMQILVSEDGKLRDVSQYTQRLVNGNAKEVLQGLIERIASTPSSQERDDFLNLWTELRQKVQSRQSSFVPAFSQLQAVSLFERSIHRESAWVYYANSMSVRLAALYAQGYCRCNRGVNGIEGSLSVAVGASLANTEQRVYGVIGDLSFFYDQNALWQQLKGNLRILLLNNGQGGIFRILKGLNESPVRDTLVAGSHETTAQGVCQQYKVGYRCATDEESLQEGMDWLVNEHSDKPLLLEVKTSAQMDETEFKRFYAHLRK